MHNTKVIRNNRAVSQMERSGYRFSLPVGAVWVLIAVKQTICASWEPFQHKPWVLNLSFLAVLKFVEFSDHSFIDYDLTRKLFLWVFYYSSVIIDFNLNSQCKSISKSYCYLCSHWEGIYRKVKYFLGNERHFQEGKGYNELISLWQLVLMMSMRLSCNYIVWIKNATQRKVHKCLFVVQVWKPWVK